MAARGVLPILSGLGLDTFNSIVAPVCRVNPDGTVVDALACRERSILEIQQNQSDFERIGIPLTLGLSSLLIPGAALFNASALAVSDERVTTQELGSIGAAAIGGRYGSFAADVAFSSEGGYSAQELVRLGASAIPIIDDVGGTIMGDNGFFSDVGDFFGDFSFSDILPSSETFSSLVNLATPLIGAAFAPQPAARPLLPSVNTFGGSAQPVMSSGAMVAMGSTMLAAARPILFKIAQYLGLRTIPSLSKAMTYVRNLGKAQLAPVAIAAALGITVEELARLIVTDKNRKHRRMNPANVKALRRGIRRIESFHRLCGKADVLRARGRRKSSASTCRKCRSNPCAC